GRGREGGALSDRGLGRDRPEPRPYLGHGAARADADRQEGRRFGGGAASRRHEALRDPRGEFPLAGVVGRGRSGRYGLRTSRSSLVNSSTVPRVPPASLFFHSPSVSKRRSFRLSAHGLTASRIAF